MKIVQKEILLPPAGKGFHLITNLIVDNLPELIAIKSGLVNILIQHTSASLTINENADPDVRKDMENYFSSTVRENESYYLHTAEGADDMPAHIKTSILGSTITIPVSEGRLALGIWQGIYLCEHRKNARRRKLIITMIGEELSNKI